MDPSPRPLLRHRLLVGALVLVTVCGLAGAPVEAATASSGGSSDSGEASTDATEPQPPGRRDTRIVGGSPAPAGKWPSQVALLHSGNSSNYYGQFCGGTLIARSWVLTAGHCLRDGANDWNLAPSGVDVLVGTQDLTSGGTRIRAVEFRVHPDWEKSTTWVDLALIRLDKPAPASIPVQAITAQGVSPAAGTPVTTTGWGTRTEGVQDQPTQLYEVTLNVSTPQACENGYGGFYESATMVCAAAPGKDSCQGDSGGPLVENRGGSWIQVGIVSTGEGCAVAGFPGIYTKVASYSSWIKAQIRYGAQPDAASFVRRMYVDAYNRQPTASELNAGTANLRGGQAPEVYARNLLNQSTYQTRTGGVIRLYQAVFLRRPDTDGLAYWWKEANRGVSLKRIANQMVTAPEFKTRYGPKTNGEFVDLVYQNVLERAPSAPDKAYWVGELDSGRRTRGQVMVGFSESAEYKNKTAARVRVIGDFFALLRRVPPIADIDYWSTQSGQSLVSTIVKGYEYAYRF